MSERLLTVGGKSASRPMTDINIATTTDGYTFDLSQACGNILTGLNGVAATVPFAVVSE